MQLDELSERNARAMWLRAPRIDRSGLSTSAAQDVDYRREARMQGSRPLPCQLADIDAADRERSRERGTSAALMQALEVPVGARVLPTGYCWEDLDVPAFRFVGLRMIAASLGITPTMLHEHMGSPDFPKGSIRRIGWLHVTDIDHIFILDEWLQARRVGQNKNHIRKREPTGRAVHSART